MSARCLDDKRLGKQRVEVIQILQSLFRTPVTSAQRARRNHPAVRMWEGSEGLLCDYGMVICAVWIYERFFLDECLPQIARFRTQCLPSQFVRPWWLGIEEFHRSHQSNLLRKNLVHYRKYFSVLTDDMPYWWPTEHDETRR